MPNPVVRRPGRTATVLLALAVALVAVFGISVFMVSITVTWGLRSMVLTLAAVILVTMALGVAIRSFSRRLSESSRF